MIKLIKKEPSLEFVIPVLKWLKDPESVSEDERRANYEAAFAAFNSTAAYDVTYCTAVRAAHAGCTAYVKYIVCNVDKYFTKISLTREEVESELFKGEEVEYNKEFFKNAKIKIESVEHSKYVQELAFEVGLFCGGHNPNFIHVNARFIYFIDTGLMNFGHDLKKFESSKYKEIFIPLPVEETEPVNDVVQTPKLSTDYLSESKDVQLGRASQYGAESKGERSFQAVAEAFNALTGEKLSGSDICLVQMCLKIVRQNSDKSRLHDDSLLDAVSYTSLWAEELNNEIL